MATIDNCTALAVDCGSYFSSNELNDVSISCNGEYDCASRNDENPYFCYNGTLKETPEVDDGYNRYLIENYVSCKIDFI